MTSSISIAQALIELKMLLLQVDVTSSSAKSMGMAMDLLDDCLSAIHSQGQKTESNSE